MVVLVHVSITHAESFSASMEVLLHLALGAAAHAETVCCKQHGLNVLLWVCSKGCAIAEMYPYCMCLMCLDTSATGFALDVQQMGADLSGA